MDDRRDRSEGEAAAGTSKRADPLQRLRVTEIGEYIRHRSCAPASSSKSIIVRSPVSFPSQSDSSTRWIQFSRRRVVYERESGKNRSSGVS